MARHFRMDALIAAYNLDASESVQIERALLGLRAKLFEVRFPQFNAELWIPPEAQRVDPGLNHWTYGYITHYATVKLHTGMSSRGPRAEVKRTEATPIAFVTKTNSYGYSVQDLRSSNLSNFDLPGNKAKAARMGHEQYRDELLFMADGSDAWEGRRGLFKLPVSGAESVRVYTVGTGALGSKLWSMKTALEMLADMHGICDGIISNSNGVETPNVLGLPLQEYLRAARTPMGDGNTASVLEHFLKTRRAINPGFVVEPHWRLATAGASSDGRMIAYERSPEKVARVESIVFNQAQPQIEAWETVTDCESRSAGVYSPYPLSVSYGDGISA